MLESEAGLVVATQHADTGRRPFSNLYHMPTTVFIKDLDTVQSQTVSILLLASMLMLPLDQRSHYLGLSLIVA
jgi:hypothetical protein